MDAGQPGGGATVEVNHPPLKAPFPWYGGKSRAAELIWARLGDVPNFVEPFFGSGAVLLCRPHVPRLETVNDLDAYLCNVWRALAADPAAVAHWCDRPPNEADQHAVHTWLVGQRETFTARLLGDPDYYDARGAGRWLYGICCWIGSGWCSGDGPWQSVNGQLAHTGDTGGNGVHRQLLHLGDAGRGVHRQRLHLRNAGMGVHRTSLTSEGLPAYFAALQARLRHVRVCCGDWRRVLGPSVTWVHGLTGILLDPPYQASERVTNIYTHDTANVAEDVRQWALDHGEHPLLRIVLCGYETDTYTMPTTWEKVAWTTNGGYGNLGQGRGRTNAQREVLWCSPGCLKAETQSGSQLRWTF
jgi:DNA adenine methylase